MPLAMSALCILLAFVEAIVTHDSITRRIKVGLGMKRTLGDVCI
jgi:hypothetical protein